jgi:hypothetical protein
VPIAITKGFPETKTACPPAAIGPRRTQERLALVEPLACLGEAAGASQGRSEIGEMRSLPEAPADDRRPEALYQVGDASLVQALGRPMAPRRVPFLGP